MNPGILGLGSVNSGDVLEVLQPTLSTLFVVQGVDIVTAGNGNGGYVLLSVWPDNAAFCVLNVGSSADWLTYRGAVPLKGNKSLRVSNQSNQDLEFVAWGYFTLDWGLSM